MKHLTSNIKPVIVSYASKGREDYNKGLDRLHDSLIKCGWEGDYWLHSKERDGNLTSCNLFEHKEHFEVPYLFKFTMIQTLREQGYTKIIWLDSSLVLDRADVTDLLNVGVMCYDNLGHPLYKYISDEAVKNLEIKTEELLFMKQTWGGAIGFDFSREWVCELFSKIIEQAHKGSFNEGSSERYGFVAHRHDQAVMSVIFSQYGVPFLQYGNIVTYPHYMTNEYGNSFYISHRPIA